MDGLQYTLRNETVTGIAFLAYLFVTAIAGVICAIRVAFRVLPIGRQVQLSVGGVRLGDGPIELLTSAVLRGRLTYVPANDRNSTPSVNKDEGNEQANRFFLNKVEANVDFVCAGVLASVISIQRLAIATILVCTLFGIYNASGIVSGRSLHPSETISVDALRLDGLITLLGKLESGFFISLILLLMSYLLIITVDARIRHWRYICSLLKGDLL